MLHTGGKDNLGAGTPELLQAVDEMVQRLGGGEQHLNQHTVVSGHTVALHHVLAAFNIRIELRFALGVQLQIDESLDTVTQRRGIHLCLVSPQKPGLFQPGNPGGYRRGGQKHLLGNFLQRSPGIRLQNVNDSAVNVVHAAAPFPDGV